MSLPKFNSVDEYIDYFPQQAALLNKLRNIVLNISPAITERMRYNNPFYDYFGMFLFIAVQNKNVVISFVEGVLMSDEAGAFIPSKLKQVRHLQYKTQKDIDEEIIVQYVQEAMLVQEMKKRK